MKRYQVSGLLGNKRIKIYILSNSPENAIKIFKQKFKNAEDIYLIQDLFRRRR